MLYGLMGLQFSDEAVLVSTHKDALEYFIFSFIHTEWEPPPDCRRRYLGLVQPGKDNGKIYGGGEGVENYEYISATG